MKNKKKEKNTVLIISILIAVLVLIGVSLAIFAFSKTGSKQNVITLGSLKLTLTESDEINLEDTLPMTDKEGLATTGYAFTLTNDGTTSVNYSIYLDDVSLSSQEVALDTKFLKYNLTIDNTIGTAKYLNTLGTNSNRIITSGTITKGQSIAYNLKIWVTTEIDGDISGQVWKGKIRLTGTQVS